MNDVRNQIKKELLLLGSDVKGVHISELNDQRDFKENLIKSDLLTFDFSKQRLNSEILNYLLQIPDLISLKDSLNSLFKGEIYNPSEGIGVSHTLYRSKNPNNSFELIFNERERIKSFLDKRQTDFSYKNLICLCIGGSRLGPELLDEFQSLNGPVKIYFCSSYDLEELKVALLKCQQKETIVFVASKSFKTTEILKNLEYVKSWFMEKPEINIEDRLYGISANASVMSEFGIKEANQFLILDSLGGRFSIWSSISLPAFVNSDSNSYLELLQGAYLADEYTNNAPWNLNISVLMALLSVWNRNALDISNHGIFTYNFEMRSLTKYIAQLSMESNGKSINFDSHSSPFPAIAV